MITYTFVYIPHTASQYEHINSRTIPFTLSATSKYFVILYTTELRYHLQCKHSYGKFRQTYSPLATDVHTLYIKIYLHLATNIACSCMCVPLHTPRTWCLRGVCIGNAHTHIERVCVLPIFTRAYTHAPCVCVVNGRVSIGNAHKRCTRYVCKLHVFCVRALYRVSMHSYIQTYLPLAKHIALTCMCVILHTPRIWFVGGVLPCMLR